MKKIYMVLIHIFIIVGLILNIYQYNNHQTKMIINSIKKNNSNLLSIMMENDQGEYEESKSNEWPDEGYIFDSSRSKCENGGQINYQNSKVQLTTSGSDRCYVYFALDTMANKCELGYADASGGVCTILKNYGKDKTLYYHDGIADYEGMENSNLEAGDLSYRYSGASPEVNNYVCLDGITKNGNCQMDADLYRIIGIFKNEYGEYEIKLIKYDYVTKEELGDSAIVGGAYAGNYTSGDEYYKGHNYVNIASYYWCNRDNNMWQYSNFNKINLNEYYLNTYLSKVKGLFNQINIHKWIIGGIGEVGNTQVTFNSELGMNKLTTNDIYCYSEDDNTTPQKCQKEDLEYPSKIGLMYVSDYAYAAKSEFWNQYMGGDEGYGSSTVREQNWLYMGLDEWTMSRLSTLGINPWHSVSWGRAGNYKASAANRSARPTFYLIADTKFASGDGTYSNPYRLFLT